MKIGEALIKAGLITQEQLDQALEEQQKSNDRLGDIFLRKGLVSPEQIAPVLAKYFHIPFVKLKDINYE